MYIIGTFVCNLCTKLTENLQKLIVYKMYTKCIPHFVKLLYTICRQN